MAKARESAELIGDGLAWIDFPGVDVEMNGTSGSLNFSKSPASEPPGEDSEVAPTTDWNPQSWELEHADGMFSDLVFSVGKKVGIQGRVWDTISVVVHGHHTAIVLKAMLLQDGQCPWRFLRDGECRRAKVSNGIVCKF